MTDKDHTLKQGVAELRAQLKAPELPYYNHGVVVSRCRLNDQDVDMVLDAVADMLEQRALPEPNVYVPTDDLTDDLKLSWAIQNRSQAQQRQQLQTLIKELRNV